MVEQKFQQFRKTIKPQEFNSIEFLAAKAEQLEKDDPDLSKRILVRVDNLRRQTKKSEVLPEQVTSADANEDKPTLVADIQKNAVNSRISRFFKTPVIVFVVLPTLFFAFYQLFLATERYESQAKVIVQQPDGMATMDSSMALLTGLTGAGSGISDTEVVKAYIYSNDMLVYLQDKLSLREHYSQPFIDLFSRMDEDATQESFLNFYQKHVSVEINSQSNVISIDSQAFSPEFAQQLAQTITERAEWFINSIGHQLAESQLEFIKKEHQNVEISLEQAQTRLLQFQQKYNLLDPTAEGIAMQKITYELEGQITLKEAELKGLSSIMSANAPQVINLRNQLNALKKQLERERNKLSTEKGEGVPVSEILAKFTDLKVKNELALQAYTSSQVSLEKSRIEAYRQLKYLITIESATKPEENKYPEIFYNICLFSLLLVMVFAVVRIVYFTIIELK